MTPRSLHRIGPSRPLPVCRRTGSRFSGSQRPFLSDSRIQHRSRHRPCGDVRSADTCRSCASRAPERPGSPGATTRVHHTPYSTARQGRDAGRTSRRMALRRFRWGVGGASHSGLLGEDGTKVRTGQLHLWIRDPTVGFVASAVCIDRASNFCDRRPRVRGWPSPWPAARVHHHHRWQSKRVRIR
jgi:hypothetical protein